MSLETMTKLATVTVSSSVASASFTNIPQSYSDLVVLLSVRTTAAEEASSLHISLNGLAQSVSTSQYLVTNAGAPFGGSSTGWVAYANGNTSTANIFSNTELIISDYATNNYKTLTSDTVQENNGSTAYMGFLSNVWANTSPVTSITITPVNGSLAQFSTVTLYGVKNLIKSISSAKPRVIGGTLTSDSQYYYRTFTSSGTLSISGGSLDADVLVIAGGGAGGASVASGYYGGGGGAGGVLLHNTKSLTGNQTVLIGAGGAYPLANRRGLKGGDSVFGTCTPSIGGGGGGGGSDQFDLIYSEQNGGPGGSGGGGQSAANATYSVPRGAGGSGTTGQGNNGGQGGGVFAVEPQAGGGGGGAGGAGGDANAATPGGAGGSGTAAYTTWGLATGTGQLSGGVYYYAGGGGGASNGTGGAAGVGGGGAGGGAAGADGTANTGGGAGNGRVGGSGLVIVRYTKTQVD
jgi:hypothetical protein